VLQGSDIEVVDRWTGMADKDAFASVVAQVKSWPTDDVDCRDGALLTYVSTKFAPGSRHPAPASQVLRCSRSLQDR
jgi:hypothetical protein